MVKGICDDLSLLRSDGWIASFQGPSGRIYIHTVLDGEIDGGLLEGVEEHGKAICKGGTTKTEGVHKGRGKNCSVACVTIAQETLEGSEEFKGQRTRFLLLMDKKGL
jgi:hypothetical protein